jgi:stage II sporulation protein D
VSDFVRRLKDAGYDVGALKGISLSPMRQGDAKDRDRGISGRVKYIVAKGPRSSRQVPGDALQSMLGLPSTLFDFSVKGKNLVVTGYGSGHGLGLSQWGAEAMAEEHGDGKDYYKQILTHYYQNTKVEKIY